MNGALESSRTAESESLLDLNKLSSNIPEELRLIFALGALLIFKEAFEILKAQDGLESTLAAVTLLPVSAFLVLYLFSYGFSMVDSLRDDYKNWFKTIASDFYKIAFETTILFTVYFRIPEVDSL